jgi:hypothetical protein
MADSIKTVSLPQVLQILEGEAGLNQTYFVDPSGSLETFFTYKGSLLECHKYALKAQLNGVESVSEEIREKLVNGLKNGEWIVLSSGQDSSFDFSKFFSQFKWFNSKFFQNTEILTKKYLLSSGILKKEEDVDFFGNKEYYRVSEKAKILYYTSCLEGDIKKIKAANTSVSLEYIFLN